MEKLVGKISRKNQGKIREKLGKNQGKIRDKLGTNQGKLGEKLGENQQHGQNLNKIIKNLTII